MNTRGLRNGISWQAIDYFFGVRKPGKLPHSYKGEWDVQAATTTSDACLVAVANVVDDNLRLFAALDGQGIRQEPCSPAELPRVNSPNRRSAKTGHFLEGAHSLEIWATVRTFESAMQV
jgi:hypothetical protein